MIVCLWSGQFKYHRAHLQTQACRPPSPASLPTLDGSGSSIRPSLDELDFFNFAHDRGSYLYPFPPSPPLKSRHGSKRVRGGFIHPVRRGVTTTTRATDRRLRQRRSLAIAIDRSARETGGKLLCPFGLNEQLTLLIRRRSKFTLANDVSSEREGGPEQ